MNIRLYDKHPIPRGSIVSNNTFIALTAPGIARASLGTDNRWNVEFLLTDCDVRCLAVDPLNQNIVYAGSQSSGVLRSNDMGRTWQPSGLAGMRVRSLAVSRLNPRTVYAGTKPPMLFVSHDSGSSWVELRGFRAIRRWFWFSPAEPPSLIPSVQSIALSPSNPNVILVGIEAGAVVRSADGGQTWTGHRPGAVRDCHMLAFHATNGDWVYESGGTGVAVSSDAGLTWKQPPKGLDRRYGWACAADPVYPDVWYVSASPMFTLAKPGPPAAHVDGKANAYIFRWAGGSMWEKLGGGLSQPLNYMAYGLLTHPDQPGHLYAGLSNGEVWHGSDYGDRWQRLPFNLKRIHLACVMI